jgi:hypothetical protein
MRGQAPRRLARLLAARARREIACAPCVRISLVLMALRRFALVWAALARSALILSPRLLSGSVGPFFRPSCVGPRSCAPSSFVLSALALCSFASPLLFWVGLGGPAFGDGGPAFSLRRAVSLYDPFMDRSPTNLVDHGRTFGDPRALVERGALDDLKRAGFDALRLPLAPRPLLEQSGERLEASVAEAARGLDLILGHGFNVVLDLHVGSGDEPWQAGGITRALDAPAFEAYLRLVERMGRLVARYDPRRVAFEPFNEPPGPCAWSRRPDWSQFQRRIFKAARAAAPRATLVLTGACWGNWNGLIQLDPSDYDDNALFSFHFYDPHVFTHQGTANVDDAAHYVSRAPWPATEEQTAEALARALTRIEAEAPAHRRAALAAQARGFLSRASAAEAGPHAMGRRVEAVKAWADGHGLAPGRVIVGEFGATKDLGATRGPAPADRTRWLAAARMAFEAAGFGWIAWNYHRQGGLIEGEAWGRLDPAAISALGLRP